MKLPRWLDWKSGQAAALPALPSAPESLHDAPAKACLLSLRFRIAALAVAVLVAAFGLAGWYSLDSLESQLKSLTEAQLRTTADYVAGDLQDRIKTRFEILQELVKRIDAQQSLDPRSVDSIAKSMAIPQALFPLGGGIIDAGGVLIAEFGTPIPARRLLSTSMFRSYLSQLNGCKPSMLFGVGPAIRYPSTAFAVPICDLRGDLKGVAFGITTLSDRNLFGPLFTDGINSNGYVLVVSRDTNRIVAASDPAILLKSYDPGNDYSASQTAPPLTIFGRPQDLSEKRVISATQVIEQANLLVVASIPTAAPAALVADLRSNSLFAGFLIVVLVAVVLYLGLSLLLRPLDIASRTMQGMRDGVDTLHLIPVVRNDEIGRLIRAFNRLVVKCKASQERIEHIALHDTLTGIGNRTRMEMDFATSAGHAVRHGSALALLHVDIDHLKSINDSLGYAVGDEVMKIFASRLVAVLRPDDFVCRSVGDEFLVLLRDRQTTEELEMTVESLLASLAAPLSVDGTDLSMTASIGVGLFPGDAAEFATLCKKANAAMVDAKEAGRNTFRFFDKYQNLDLSDRVNLRSSIKSALSNHEFELHYQPQFDLRSGTLVGAEALIRWRHPKRGMVPPMEFIPFAEDTGLIVEIGDWVLHEACRQAVVWHAAGQPQLVIAVNISAVQFKRGNLEQTVLDILRQTGIDPARLELELTESVLIKDTETVLHSVRCLKELGITISIDDFGTGYSSLCYLKKFAVDKIKIDQSFVRDLRADSDDAAIVKAIIQMARGLNLKTIAEGVEDRETEQSLRNLMCDEVQGYLYAKPLDATEFTRRLSNGEFEAALATTPFIAEATASSAI